MPSRKTTQPEGDSAAAPPGFPQMNWGQTQDCMMCPLGLAFMAVRNVKPEVMEHLMKAGFELTLAFKALVDQAAERWQSPSDDDDGLQRITVR